MTALVKSGANINARNARGETPLGALLARKSSQPETVELLRRLGGGV